MDISFRILLKILFMIHKERCEVMFKKYDVDKTGALSREEVFKALHDYGYMKSATCKEEQEVFSRIIDLFDVDDNLEVERHEFSSLIHYVSHKRFAAEHQREHLEAACLGLSDAKYMEYQSLFWSHDPPIANRISIEKMRAALEAVSEKRTDDEWIDLVQAIHDEQETYSSSRRIEKITEDLDDENAVFEESAVPPIQDDTKPVNFILFLHGIHVATLQDARYKMGVRFGYEKREIDRVSTFFEALSPTDGKASSPKLRKAILSNVSRVEHEGTWHLHKDNDPSDVSADLTWFFKERIFRKLTCQVVNDFLISNLKDLGPTVDFLGLLRVLKRLEEGMGG
jgi:hypothetical protein